MNNVSTNSLAALLQATGGDRRLFEGASGSLSLSAFRHWVSATCDAYGSAMAGQRVAIGAGSIDEFCVCLFAIWASSGTAVLLPSSGTALQAWSGGVTDRSRCDLVIQAVPRAEASWMASSAGLRLSGDAALILYTSGSTGEPKQIRKTLRQLQDEQDRLRPLIAGAYEGALVAGTVSPQHFYGLVFLVLAALVNGGVILDSWLDGLAGLAQFVGLRRKRVLVSSPALLDRWTELSFEGAPDDAPLAALSAGGQLRQGTRDRFRNARASNLIEIYGSSETGVIAYRAAGPHDDWTPFPGVVVTSLDDEGVRVESSYADGGSTVLADAVTLDAETGALRLHGRLDRTVKVEERRLSLPEMERELLAHPLVRDAACCAIRPDGALRVSIGAAVVLISPDGLLLDSAQRQSIVQSLKASLASSFHATLLPRQWRFVMTIPRSSLGKVLQPEVLGLFQDR